MELDLTTPAGRARALGWVRLLVGVAFFVAPRLTTRGWIGPDADGRGTPIVVRSVGVRDVALGLGTVLAVDAGELRRWLQAAVLSDAGDAIATAMAGGRPLRARIPAVLTAAGAGVAGIAVDRALATHSVGTGGIETSKSPVALVAPNAASSR